MKKMKTGISASGLAALAMFALSSLASSTASAQSAPAVTCPVNHRCAIVTKYETGGTAYMYGWCFASKCVLGGTQQACVERETEKCNSKTWEWGWAWGAVPADSPGVEQPGANPGETRWLHHWEHKDGISDPRCDDGDPGTLDLCQDVSSVSGQICRHYLVDPAQSCTTCNEDSECDDGDRSTINWCDAGRCQSSERSGGACTEVDEWSLCFRDRHCDDRDSNTVDWCHADECKHMRRGSRVNACEPAPECVRNRDCRDGDRSTKNWCHEGTCHSVAKDDPNCTNLDQACWRNRDCGNRVEGEVYWCHEGQCRSAKETTVDTCEDEVLGNIKPAY